MEKKMAMLGGGGRIIWQTSEYWIFLSCLFFSRQTILHIVVNQVKHSYV